MAKPHKTKDGRWRAEIELPVSSDGKRRRKYIFGKTRQECAQKQYKFIQELEEQKILNNKDITVAQYMEKWFEINCAQLSPTTQNEYSKAIKTYIIPLLGDLKLKEIMQLTIQNFVNELSKTRKSKTCNNIKGVLNKAFNDAITNNIIKYNPCANIKVRKSKKYEYYIYNEEEFNALLNIVKGTTEEIPIILAALCGMRTGEIMGLRWENVNFEQNKIEIYQNAVIVNGSVILKEPKTFTSTRVVPIPQYVMNVLRKYKKNSGYVYSHKNDNTEAENGNSYGKRFRKLLIKHNLPLTRFHDLRHFNATMMLKHGISDKEASELLGHSEINMTKKYQHVLKSMENRAANVFDKIVGGQNGGQKDS